jgi:ATP-dependent 26S proteasome regulatory subunit
MNVHPDVNFEELARSTDDFNGAQLKAVCVEAGMLALRRDATEVCTLWDFVICCTVDKYFQFGLALELVLITVLVLSISGEP